MLMIWPVPDAPAMACHESGGLPARSVATLGGENDHLRVDGLHLRCPTNSSRAPQVPFLSTVRCPIGRLQGEGSGRCTRRTSFPSSAVLSHRRAGLAPSR